MKNHEKQSNNKDKPHKKRGNAWKTDKGIYMNGCCRCGKESYAPAVVTGQCVWCGYKATEEDIDEK